VLAYAYTDILDHPSIVQSTLHHVMYWGPRDYWFPEIHSLGGGRIDVDTRALPLRLFIGARLFSDAGSNPILCGALAWILADKRVFACVTPYRTARNRGGAVFW
jgi:hypothetical protein